MEEFLTTKELSIVLKVHRQTISKCIKNGMPFILVAGSTRFKLSECEQWFRESGDKKAE